MASESAQQTEFAISQSIFEQAIERLPESSVITDADQRIIYVNPAFERITGYRFHEVRGRDCRLLQGAETDGGEVARIEEALLHRESFVGTLLNYRRDGSTFWNSLAITPITDLTGRVTHYASVQRDVTDVHILQEQTLSLLEQTKIERGTAAVLLEVARALGRLSTVQEIAQRLSDIVPSTLGADRGAFARWDPVEERATVIASTGWEDHAIIRALDAKGPTHLPAFFDPFLSGPDSAFLDRRSSGAFRTRMDELGLEAMVVTPVRSGSTLHGVLLGYWNDDAPERLPAASRVRLGGLATIAAAALDVASLVDQASWDARHDALTGLPNRVLFEESMTTSLAAESGTASVAVIVCDIDRLKRINDTLGHRGGDSVLRHVAGVLLDSAGEGALVARIGGDEFVILVNGADPEAHAAEIVDRIKERLLEPVLVRESTIFVQVSTGTAISSPSAPAEGESLLYLADAAMYQHKFRRTGDAMVLHPRNALRLDADLRGAVGRGEIVPAFQPQIDLATGRVVAAEALARWVHPELGVLSPDLFIPLAEENGLIDEIGAFVLRAACDLAVEIRSEGVGIDVSVNVSATQLDSADFPDQVHEAIRESGLPAEGLVLEITESHVVLDPEGVGAGLARLRETGVHISIDDFGTGYSSLTQLLRLPFSEIKIDRSFLQSDQSTGGPLISAVVGIAAALGFRVVAEGVESPEQLELVRSLGCDRAQGHGLGMPVTADELRRQVLEAALRA